VSSASTIQTTIKLSNDAFGNDKRPASILTGRLPTSVEDQVRQVADAIRKASLASVHRHAVRLLLPVVRSTELDDWPGGVRQMVEAADPLVDQILRQLAPVGAACITR
jgi:hypothetical protein